MVRRRLTRSADLPVRSCGTEPAAPPCPGAFRHRRARSALYENHVLGPAALQRAYRRRMRSVVQSFLLLIAHATDRELARYLEFLKAENRILRGKLPERITVTPRER